MTDPADAETYSQYMMLVDELEREEAAANVYHQPRERTSPGYDFGIPAGGPGNAARAILLAARARRASERAAAALASERYYLLTARGRQAAERVDAAARAQLDATKETT